MKAQLRSSSGRSSKLLKDRERIEAVVEVEGVGKLVLCVDGRGRYSLRGYLEGTEAQSRDQIASRRSRADSIAAVRPNEVPAGEYKLSNED